MSFYSTKHKEGAVLPEETTRKINRWTVHLELIRLLDDHLQATVLSQDGLSHLRYPPGLLFLSTHLPLHPICGKKGGRSGGGNKSRERWCEGKKDNNSDGGLKVKCISQIFPSSTYINNVFGVSVLFRAALHHLCINTWVDVCTNVCMCVCSHATWERDLKVRNLCVSFNWGKVELKFTTVIPFLHQNDLI